MNKTIDFSKTVYEICSGNPDVIDIMKEIGFESIANPAVLKTAGRFMTIPKGAEMKGIDLGKIIRVFQDRGYAVKS